MTSQPVYYKEMVLFGESSGSLRIVNAQDGKDLHTYNTGKGILVRPVVDAEKGEVFVFSTEARLYALKVSWKRSDTLLPWQTL